MVSVGVSLEVSQRVSLGVSLWVINSVSLEVSPGFSLLLNPGG